MNSFGPANSRITNAIVTIACETGIFLEVGHCCLENEIVIPVSASQRPALEDFLSAHVATASASQAGGGEV